MTRDHTLRFPTIQFGIRSLLISLCIVVAACSGDDNDGNAGLADIDAQLEQFVADEESFAGAGIVIVDKDEGIIHMRSFGAYTDDTIVQLASTSKVPSSLIMLALDEDGSIDFDIQAPIETYLEGEPAYPGVTVEHALSNTSGIPGLWHLTDALLKMLPHYCQFEPNTELSVCAQHLFTTRLDFPRPEPGTQFDYGGAQWQLAGAVAEKVSGKTWNQVVDERLVQPCELEVFEYGNMYLDVATLWMGTVESLIGRSNPSLEGGAITNMRDYAKILQLQINGGYCGGHQVLTQSSLDFMHIDRGTATGSTVAFTGTAGNGSGQGYGLGLWIKPTADSEDPYIYLDPGAFGSTAWIDVKNGYGAYIMLEDLNALAELVEYGEENRSNSPIGKSSALISRLIPEIEAIMVRRRVAAVLNGHSSG